MCLLRPLSVPSVCQRHCARHEAQVTLADEQKPLRGSSSDESCAADPPKVAASHADHRDEIPDELAPRIILEQQDGLISHPRPQQRSDDRVLPMTRFYARRLTLAMKPTGCPGATVPETMPNHQALMERLTHQDL